MNKKDLIKALGAGLAFGLLTFCFMMIAIHFIESQAETEEVLTFDFNDFAIDYRFLPVEPETQAKPDVAMVTFKYEIRIQNRYEDEMLERTETLDEAIDYIIEYSRFHNDLYIYDLKTEELMVDSETINETMRSLKTKEAKLIEVSQYPETFSDAEIFDLLVD